MHAGRVHPQQALAVYVESFAAGARVAVFGDASLGLGERLIALGARSVHLWDPAEFAASAPASDEAPGLVVEAYDAFVPPIGTVDVAIVPELGQFEDPAELVARVRDLVGDEGVALIGATNAGIVSPASGDVRAFDYYELFDRVAVEFESVRMVAELRFRGVALVALGEADDAPAVSVDTQLADPDRAPLGFLAIASQNEVPVDPFAIIEVGGDDDEAVLAGVAAATAAAAERSALAAAEQSALAAAERNAAERNAVAASERSALIASERNAVAAAERSALIASERNAVAAAERSALIAAEQSAFAEVARRAANEATDRAADAELRLRGEIARATDLEGLLATRERQLMELSAEVEEMRAAAEAGRIAAAEVETLARRSDRAEARATALERETVSLADNQATELQRLEGALRDRSQAARLLEAEVVRRDRIVRDLVAALEEAGQPAPDLAGLAPLPAAPPTPPEIAPAAPLPVVDARAAAAVEEAAGLREQLDSLALEVARREGEAQATAWTVAELERRLALADRNGTAAAGGPAMGGFPALEHSADAGETEALRQALVQEHEARRRAESGEALAAAQAEIERLTVLLQQTQREHGGAAAETHPQAGATDDAS